MLRNYPIIKLIPIFIGGILTGNFIWADFTILSLINVVLILLILLVVLFSKRFKSNFILTLNILIYLLIFFSGMQRISSDKIKKGELPPTYKIDAKQVYGKVESVELPNANKIEFIGIVDSIRIQRNTFLVNKKFLIKPSSKYQRRLKNINIGSRFVLSGNLQSARDKRNPGEFDYRKYLYEKNIFGTISFHNINFNETPNFNFFNIIKEIRFGIFDKINKLYTNNHAALISGLLLAYRKNLDYDTIEMFINSGVIHVLAVSGLHVGFISIIFLFLFSRFNIYLKYAFTIVGLIIFSLLTNLQPSVMRASIMAVTILISILLLRKNNSFNSISVAAFLILIIWPNDLFNAGFQLSFSAVLSILIFYPMFQKKIILLNISKTFKNFLLFLSVSLSAQIGTLPFTLIYFHKLSVIALLANLIVIPLIGIIVSIGIFSVAVSFISIHVGHIIANTNNLLMWILFAVVKYLGNPDYSFITIRQFSIYDFSLFYLMLYLTYLFVNKMRSIKAKVICLILILFNFIVYEKIDNKDFTEKGKLKVLMTDVGQGDSFIITFPDKKVAMVDAGAATKYFDNGERVLAPLLNHLDVNKIDYAFVSHIDNDHYAGFLYLLDKLKFVKIYKPVLNVLREADVNFEFKIRKKKIPITYYEKSIIKGKNYRIYILNNNSNLHKNESENEKSGIIKIQYGKTSFLFVGDAGYELENKLIKRYGDFLKSDVLKVGHHGSKYSTSREFLSYVKPKIALVSVGKYNNFNHPSPLVIQLLKKNKIKILRTDEMGAVILTSNGNNIFREYYD